MDGNTERRAQVATFGLAAIAAVIAVSMHHVQVARGMEPGTVRSGGIVVDASRSQQPTTLLTQLQSPGGSGDTDASGEASGELSFG